MRLPIHPTATPEFASVQRRQVFTREECQQIIRLCTDAWKPAAITRYGDEGRGGVHPEVRSVLTQRMPVDGGGWPLRELGLAVASVNEQIYRFALTGFPDRDPPSVLRYESSAADHFQAHRDVGPAFPTRKLSCIVQLSDPDDYRGGSLIFPEDRAIADSTPGMMTVFPSFLIHSVTPVVAGERHVIVAWAHGPTFR